MGNMRKRHAAAAAGTTPLGREGKRKAGGKGANKSAFCGCCQAYLHCSRSRSWHILNGYMNMPSSLLVPSFMCLNDPSLGLPSLYLHRVAPSTHVRIPFQNEGILISEIEQTSVRRRAET